MDNLYIKEMELRARARKERVSAYVLVNRANEIHQQIRALEEKRAELLAKADEHHQRAVTNDPDFPLWSY